MTPAEQKAVEILREEYPDLNDKSETYILRETGIYGMEAKMLVKAYNSGWNDAVKEAAEIPPRHPGEPTAMVARAIIKLLK